jgi:hypothetical protein
MSSKKVTRQLSIYINDREVVNSLAGVNREIGKVSGQMRNLNKSSETYDEDLKRLQKTLAELKNKQAEFKEEIFDTSQAASQLKENFTKFFVGLATGNIKLAAEGMNGLKGSIVGVTKAGLAFIATPIGATIAVLAGIALATREFINFNREIQKSTELIENLTGKTGQANEDIRTYAQGLANTFDIAVESLINAADTLTDTGLAKTELEALEQIKNGLLTAPDKNEFISSLEKTAVVATNLGLDLNGVIQLKKQIEDNFGDVDATFKVIEKANRALGQQSETVRKALSENLGDAFSNDLLKKVEVGSITTIQAMDAIKKKGDELNINQRQQADIAANIFGKSIVSAGGYQQVLENVSSSLERIPPQLTDLQEKTLNLADANIELEKAKSEALKSDNVLAATQAFELFWIKLKTWFFNLIDIFFDFGANAIKVVAGITMTIQRIPKVIGQVFSDVKSIISDFLSSFRDAFSAIGNILTGNFSEAGDDIDRFFEKQGSLVDRVKQVAVDAGNTIKASYQQGTNAVEEFIGANAEAARAAEAEAEAEKKRAQEAEETEKQRKERLAEQKKEAEASRKAAEAEAKRQLEAAKALADAKINLAKAELAAFIQAEKDKVDASQKLTEEFVEAEKERLMRIQLEQLRFRELENERKRADIEENAKSEEEKFLRLQALELDFQTYKQDLALEFKKTTSDLEDKLEQTIKAERMERLAIENELRLVEAQDRYEEELEAERQRYDAEVSRYAMMLDEKKITEEEFDRFITSLKARSSQIQSEIEAQRVNDEMKLLAGAADAAIAIFGQNKALSSAQALINGGLAVTQILATPTTPLTGPASAIFRGIQIAAAAATTMRSIQQINSAKPPKRAKFYHGGFTGNQGLLGFDQYGPVTGVVHKNEWVAPEVMTQSPFYASTFSWLESERKRIMKNGFFNGGPTSSGAVPNFENNQAQQSQETLNLMLSKLLDRLDNPIPPNLNIGYEEITKLNDLNNDLSFSDENGTL